jgi:hypothetical protein
MTFLTSEEIAITILSHKLNIPDINYFLNFYFNNGFLNLKMSEESIADIITKMEAFYMNKLTLMKT